MLRKDSDSLENQFAESIERYIGDTLHGRAFVCPYKGPHGWPSFIDHRYTIYEAQVLGKQCIIVAGLDTPDTPADIAKHINAVRKAVNVTTVFATMAMSAHNRSRLIRQGVPFIVPGNQLYLPNLAIDLREYFRTPKQRKARFISPIAQVILFSRILRPNENVTTPSSLAQRLQCSPMSVGRAFDDLVTTGLAESFKQGKERHIHFEEGGRILLEKAMPFLRSPVRAVKFVQGAPPLTSLKLAGEAALSLLTDLSPPRINTFAVLSTDWKATMRMYGLAETDYDAADCIVETWLYDPSALSSYSTVDILSLYVQFKGDNDERLALSADQLIERLH